MERLLLLAFAAPARALLLPPAPAVNFVLGAVAGACGAAAVYPIDYVKTQLQCGRYADGFGAVATIVEEGGVSSLYRGLPTQLVGVAPEKAIKLSVNEVVRAAVTAACGGLPLAGEVLAGACAGTSQVIVTNPLEVVKIGLQTSDVGAFELIREVGPAGLFRGAAACIARDATFSAILFPTYAHAKLLLAAAGMGGPLALGLAGTLAAAPAAFFTTPADVIKTRQQERGAGAGGESGPAAFGGGGGGAGGEARETRGVLEIGACILRDEGAPVLFSGALERVLRSAPQFGVTLGLFDVLKGVAGDNGLL